MAGPLYKSVCVYHKTFFFILGELDEMTLLLHSFIYYL